MAVKVPLRIRAHGAKKVPAGEGGEDRADLRAAGRANPTPKTELEYVNPFTLLVAVVLSAQATDVGVNKATRALFAIADTPAEDGGARRGQADRADQDDRAVSHQGKNVIALSRMLVEQHGGEVPRDREALEALPGVGRKTANVVLNVAFGEPTIAVDTHIFRVGNRTGIAPGKTPRAVEDGLSSVVADAIHAARASLADPARPLCLQGAQARVLGLRDRRSLPVRAEDPGGGEESGRGAGDLLGKSASRAASANRF